MKRSYTLVELLVVIIIIGILAGLVIPAVGSARQRARESSSAAGCATLMQALKSFETDYQKFPMDINYTSEKYTAIGGSAKAQKNTLATATAPTADGTLLSDGNIQAYDYTMALLTGYVGANASDGKASPLKVTAFGRNKKKTQYIEPPESYLEPGKEIISGTVYENGFYANSFGERYYIVWDSSGIGKLKFDLPGSHTKTVVASVAVFSRLAPYDTTTDSPWNLAERVATSWAGIIANE